MLLTSRRVAVADAAVTVVTDDAELWHQVGVVVDDLPDAPSAPGSAEHHIVVRSEVAGFTVSSRSGSGVTEDLGHCDTRPAALGLVVWALGRIVPRSRAGAVVLHAAVLAGPAGAVVACGASGTGKTTLAVAAVASGFEFLTDDAAIVDPAGQTVAPYPRAFSVRPGTRALLGDVLARHGVTEAPECATGEWIVPASRLGARIATTALPLVAVLEIARGPAPAVAPVRRAELLQAMIGHCTTIRDAPADQFVALTSIAAAVPGHRLTVDPELRALDLVAAIVGLP